jgi:hypothetical protein
LIAGQVQDILYSELPNVCRAMWDKSSWVVSTRG